MRSMIRIGLLGMALLALACQFLSSGAALRQTVTALEIQQTALAQTGVARTQAAATILAGAASATPLLPTVTPFLMPTAQAIPTFAPSGIIDIERRLKAAKILLFENMSASGYIRYVKEALDRGGYFYLDVGSATGWFDTQLLSEVEWDLVIAAAEARRDFGGDTFELIDERVAQGGAAIVEYWDLDAAPNGKVEGLLKRCGVKVQSSWLEPDMRVFFWLAPENPLFSEPNRLPGLHNAARLWSGDIGDLLEVRYQGEQPVGDAIILAGTNASLKTSNGVLVSCVDGRMILQTFASHEYQYGEMVALWQNYIYQALKSRFARLPSAAPTPAATVPAPPTPVQTATPNPPYAPVDMDFSCGGLLKARLLKYPSMRADLFEHHAAGTFLLVQLELSNQVGFPIQIWDDDYFVEGLVNGKPVSYSLSKPATGFLYIESGGHLYQDVIEPGARWNSWLAFDVNPDGASYSLVVRPGHEFGEQVCEVRIPLTR